MPASWLLARLSEAVDDANLAIPENKDVVARANQALSETGYGGKVSLDRPTSIHDAIEHLENYES